MSAIDELITEKQSGSALDKLIVSKSKPTSNTMASQHISAYQEPSLLQKVLGGAVLGGRRALGEVNALMENPTLPGDKSPAWIPGNVVKSMFVQPIQDIIKAPTDQREKILMDILAAPAALTDLKAWEQRPLSNTAMAIMLGHGLLKGMPKTAVESQPIRKSPSLKQRALPSARNIASTPPPIDNLTPEQLPQVKAAIEAMPNPTPEQVAVHAEVTRRIEAPPAVTQPIPPMETAQMPATAPTVAEKPPVAQGGGATRVVTIRGKKVELTQGPYDTKWLNVPGRRPFSVIDAAGNDVRNPPEGKLHEAHRFQTIEQARTFADEMTAREAKFKQVSEMPTTPAPTPKPALPSLVERAKSDLDMSHADLQAAGKNVTEHTLVNQALAANGWQDAEIKQLWSDVKAKPGAVAEVAKPQATGGEAVSPLDMIVTKREETRQRIIDKRNATPGKGIGDVLKEKRGSAPIDSGLGDYIEYGAWTIAEYAAKGGIKLKQFSEHMIAEFGDVIKPYLAKIWAESHAKFKTEIRPTLTQIGRDYSIADKPWMPRGIYDSEGNVIQKGWMDRHGNVPLADGKVENIGTQIGMHMTKAQRVIEKSTHEGLTEILKINELRKQGGMANDAQWVKLIELKRNDPARIKVLAAQTPVGEALRLHDKLTSEAREYILKAQRSMGKEMKEDWGVIEAGYFRRLFSGEMFEGIKPSLGKRETGEKFFASLLERTGGRHYKRIYEEAMSRYIKELYRSQELSKMNHAVQPLLTKMRDGGKPGFAEQMQKRIDSLWGHPQAFEVAFGEWVKSVPGLSKRMPNPEFAFRGLARTITAYHYWTKLAAKPLAAIINKLQPNTTLLPFITTKEYVGLALDTLRPSLRRRMRDLGVFESTGKLEISGDLKRASAAKIYKPWQWFQRSIEDNRMMGYLYGERKALKSGKSASEAYWDGMAWAEKVEFDNSTWNIPDIINSPAGRVLGQFKSFALKNAENTREIFTGKVKNRAERVGRIGKWTMAQLGAGGVKSLGMGVTALGGYKLAQVLSQQLQALGMEKSDADKWADAVYYGAPALFDMDISANVAIFEAPYGYSDAERLTNFLGGPTVSGALQLKRGIDKRSPRDIAKSTLGTHIVRTYETLADIAHSGLGGVRVRTGKNQYVKLTPKAAAGRVIGVQPLAVSKVYDKREAGIKKSAGGIPKPPKLSDFMRGIPKRGEHPSLAR